MCQDSGEFKSCLPDSPKGVHIVSATPYSWGLVFGGKNGEILIYDKTDDLDYPFKFLKKEVFMSDRAVLEHPSINSLAITSTEDIIFFITANNQLQKLAISLDGTDEESKFT